jgi:hypothetical protein
LYSFKQQSTGVVVEKATLKCDPGHAWRERAFFFGGHGSCAVKVLGHRVGQCEFAYTDEIEMGATTYLVRVSIDGGTVAVKIDRVTKEGSTYEWPVTPFSLDQAVVVRRGAGPRR